MILCLTKGFAKSETASDEEQSEEKIGYFVDAQRNQTDKVDQKLDTVIATERSFFLKKGKKGDQEKYKVVTTGAISDQNRNKSDQEQNL